MSDDLPKKTVKCTECERTFAGKRAMKEHRAAKHGEDREPSFASRLIEARIEVAMGGRADDDLVDHL